MEKSADDPVPSESGLRAAFPNPFNPTTTISYDLAEDVRVRLVVYNSMGQEVCVLVDHNESAGHKTVAWNGRDQSGHTVGSGIYFYRLTTSSGYSSTMKMTLIK